MRLSDLNKVTELSTERKILQHLSNDIRVSRRVGLSSTQGPDGPTAFILTEEQAVMVCGVIDSNLERIYNKLNELGVTV